MLENIYSHGNKKLRYLIESIMHSGGVIKPTDHFEKFSKTCHVPFLT